MEIPILNGIYVDSSPNVRTSYPRNLIPVPKPNGASKGHLKPADGIVTFGAGGPGAGRGGINWLGTLYRVMGTKLCSVNASGNVTVLGDVGGSGQASLDYSFDRLGVASNGSLWYWTTGSKFIQVTDPNIGKVLDVIWMAGYFITTDGTSIVVTNLNDPTTVSPLAYGSAEGDANPIKALDELREELYAFTRYSIQVFQNVGTNGQSGGTGQVFPFQVIDSAIVPKGIIGTHTYTSIGDTFVFLGSGRDEAPAIYMMLQGDTLKVSTQEIDIILKGYSEATLAQCLMEVQVDENMQLVYLHLPDQTLVYDTITSKTLGAPVWVTLGSSVIGPGTYRGRNMVWCYDQWNCEDPSSSALGVMNDTVSTHYGNTIGWDFGTTMLYNDGNDSIVLELELVALPGRVPLGVNPTVWTSYSTDGEVWSQERPTSAGAQGQRHKRLAWRKNGRIRHYRVQKFRGTSDAHLPVLKLEARFEPLNTRPGNG